MIDRRLFVGGVLGFSGLALSGCKGNKGTVTFASPTPVWWNAVPLIADKDGFLEKTALNVMSFNVTTGVDSRKAVVEGNAQLGIAATNAISTATDEQLKNIQILGSITQTSATVSVISRKPLSEITKTVIGYVAGTISEFYLIAYLRSVDQLEAYTSGSLKLVKLPPSNLVTAFMQGDIDTVVPWEPFGEQIRMLATDARQKIEIHRKLDLYKQQIYLIARRDVDSEIQTRMKKAMLDTCNYMTNNRPKIAATLESYFDFKKGFIGDSEIWDAVNYKFIDDKGVILEALQSDLQLAKLAGVAQVTNPTSLQSVIE